MSILLTKGNVEDVFKVLDNHNINSALMLDTKLKALEIIKEKEVSIFQLNCCKNVNEYNDLQFKKDKKLTQKEFELLKEMLE